MTITGYRCEIEIGTPIQQDNYYEKIPYFSPYKMVLISYQSRGYDKS